MKKIQANRLNALASTGPKTAHGRMRASKNARQHGLHVPLTYDRPLLEKVQALARELSAGTATIEEQSARIAEAQIDLARIRVEKQAVMERLHEAQAGTTWAKQTIDSDGAATIEFLMDQLRRIDRYERRALSRRRKAVRLYDRGDDELVIDGPRNLAERSQNDQ